MFIKEYPNNLPSTFCEELIQKFESDCDKYPGIIAEGYRPDIKSSTDLVFSTAYHIKPGYLEEDDFLKKSLNLDLSRYIRQCLIPCGSFKEASNLLLSGYQVQKTLPGEGYTWHHDFLVQDAKTKMRVITYLWYLNTVDVGGETEFLTGEKIKPEQGKLVLFPASWTHAHRGVPPLSHTKYVCTGWVLADLLELF